MTARRTTTDVPYTADQMYALVADVGLYPEFLPWCVALRIADRRVEGAVELLTADMVVAYRVFRERFHTTVRLDPKRRRIDVDYVDGPFRKLRNAWAFEDRPGGGSTIDFSIDFEFRNFLLQATAQAMFEKVFLRMSDAFIDRAGSAYGPLPPK